MLQGTALSGRAAKKDYSCQWVRMADTGNLPEVQRCTENGGRLPITLHANTAKFCCRPSAARCKEVQLGMSAQVDVWQGHTSGFRSSSLTLAEISPYMMYLQVTGPSGPGWGQSHKGNDLEAVTYV